MSTGIKDGESFDAYKARQLADKIDERLHQRGHMVFVSVVHFEKDGKKYKRSRTFTKAK